MVCIHMAGGHLIITFSTPLNSTNIQVARSTACTELAHLARRVALSREPPGNGQVAARERPRSAKRRPGGEGGGDVDDGGQECCYFVGFSYVLKR